jgi:hypothetical protein
MLILTACFNKKKEEQPTCGVKEELALPCDGRKNRPVLFLAKCTACHSLDKNGTGPKFSGVLTKIPNEKWFDCFVRNEDSLLKQKEPYTLMINKAYFPSSSFSHNFKEITSKQLEELKEYSKE